MRPLQNFATGVLLALFLLGCQSPTVSNGVAATALGIETLAEQIRLECGNTEPDGACLPDSRITTDEKQGLKRSLQAAVALLKASDSALLSGQAYDAATRLRQAEAVLDVITRWLAERGVK